MDNIYGYSIKRDMLSFLDLKTRYYLKSAQSTNLFALFFHMISTQNRLRSVSLIYFYFFKFQEVGKILVGSVAQLAFSS